MKLQELFADPENWTKYTYHAFKKDRNVAPLAKNQRYAYRDSIARPDSSLHLTSDVCHCLLGGIEAVSKTYEEQQDLHGKITGHLKSSIVLWNDAPERTHADILALCIELDI